MRGQPEQINNFDAIRLIAAAAVVVGHAWPLTGTPDPPRVAGIAIFHLAVYAFFSLSGYLVATSWLRDPRVLPFIARRASRIFPALAAVVALSILVIGPLTTTLPVASYLSSPETWRYLQNLTLAATYTLPGVFVEHPRPVVNGSLWTLGPEFLCYLSVVVVGLLAMWLAPRLRGRGTLLVFLGLASVLATVSLIPAALSPSVRVVTEAMVFFALGAALAQLRTPRLPLWPTAALFTVWMVGSATGAVPPLIWCWIALPYLVIALGSRSTPVVRQAGRFGDLSYGLYLWGFPVQQLIVLVAPSAPLAVSAAAALLGSAVIALLSWHLIEKGALRTGRRLATTAITHTLRSTKEVGARGGT